MDKKNKHITRKSQAFSETFLTPYLTMSEWKPEVGINWLSGVKLACMGC